MSELERVVRQDRIQVVFLAIALLLVGLGGLISLWAAQSYRVAQETLGNVQAFTGQLISRLPVGIIATDREGRINTINGAAASMIGRLREQAVGNWPAAVLPPDLNDLLAGSRDPGELLDREMSLAPPEGGPLTVSVSVVPVTNQEGAVMGRVLLIYDLTELKELEKRVRRHDRLVSLGKMAAGVAHEVRNPLSSIKGFATFLGSKFAAGSKEEEIASLLVAEVERLNRTISELLNYARPLPLQLAPVALGDLVRSSLQLVSSDARELGVAISTELAPELPCISGDGDRLNQVLLNLYLNAFQAMAAGGKLTVIARHLPASRKVELIVEDTGTGIGPEILERIMDPYFTTKASGTGLGLAIAQKIVDEHEGEIRFENREGGGVRATVTLPALETAS